MEIKISIITPSYNSSSFIEDCIQSVLNQNYPNFEHIIIDGASTDGTVEILKKYLHLKWISEPDEGQSDALNKGFKMATGEIIGWCNSDDVYCKDTFTKVSKYFKKNKNIDGIYSNLYFADENLSIFRRLISHRTVKWLSLFHCFIPSATFFFNKRIIENNIFIDKNKHITMDKDFFARILYAGYKLKYVNDFFAIFRWHNGNKSLDSLEIKNIRYKEGLILLNTVSDFNIPINFITVNIYAGLIYALIPLRKILRLLN